MKGTAQLTLSVSTAVAPDLTARSISFSLFTPKNLYVVRWSGVRVILVRVGDDRNDEERSKEGQRHLYK
jgi:hypothetical protein